MTRLPRFLTTSALLLLCLQADAGMYRWVDESGKVHYADVVPPHAVRQGHSQLDEQGMLVGSWPAALTPAELAEKKRSETLAKLRDVIDGNQKAHDDYLLANYNDVTELDAVFHSKLVLLERNTSNMQERRSSLAERLDALKLRIAHMSDPAKRKELAPFIHDAEQTLASYDYALQENQTEQDRLRQRYEKDRERLSKLLSASPSSPRPDRSTVPATLRAALDHQ